MCATKEAINCWSEIIGTDSMLGESYQKGMPKLRVFGISENMTADEKDRLLKKNPSVKTESIDY